jgi:glycosyltransferase involved in cell wall biosynthesis
VFNVNPMNPAFSRFGIRNPLTGEPLGDGAEIEIEHPEFIRSAQGPKDYYDEKRDRWIIRLWKDDPTGEGEFCVRRNIIATEVWRNYMRMADLVTCSTPRSEKYVLRECPTAKTFVAYNMMDIDHYPQDIVLAEHPSELRILWQGSPTHHECLWPIVPALQRVIKKYPHAKLIMWGAPYKWLLEGLGDQGKHLDYVPYPEYKVRACTLGHDISICPLKPHVFNDSRSAIKFYEASMPHTPAATLAQKWGAYGDEIIEGETGLLWETPEEFETKLCGLIEDTLLRKRLASNAKDWVLTNRTPSVLAPKLWAKYQEVLEAHRASCGPPIEVPDESVPAEQPAS